MRSRFTVPALVGILCLALFAAIWPPTAAVAAPPTDTITRAELHGYAVSGTADILTSSATCSRPSAAYRLTIALDSTDSVVNVVVSTTGGDGSYVLDLNSGTALSAGNLYTFQWGVTENLRYNLQVETGTTLAYLLLEEVP